MHQSILTVFRLFFAAVIFIVTLSLFVTCFAKLYEILQADSNYAQAQHISLISNEKEQFVLVSNNQKPDHAIFVLIAGNGYVAKISCDHYVKLCTDEDNTTHTRQIQNMNLFKAGQHTYIKNVSFIDSRTKQKTELAFNANEIQQFYKNDISNLKYVIFGIGLFALAALYVSLKILKNFRRFIGR